MDEAEKALRRKLSADLGVEFYEPDDPEMNQDVSKPSNGEAVAGKIRRISTSELIQQCNAAVDALPDDDANKCLIWNCAFAIRQLVDHIESLESPESMN